MADAGSGPDPGGTVAELRSRARRYPPERYPVQHATAQFHLGMTLAAAGHLDDADRALSTAAELFAPDNLPVEHAKARNARGAVSRQRGRLDAATSDFRAAADLFGAHGAKAEEGAARFNLGLVQREAGLVEESVASLRAAGDLLAAGPSAGAARRELGTSLLAAGDPHAALEVLEQAVADAEAAGDLPGTGAAANLAGLAALGAQSPADAVRWFLQAGAAHPRGVRPEGYAVARANLALAHEQAGDQNRARVAAGQALRSPSPPAPAAAVAAGVLDRVGRQWGAVLAVLDDEPAERHSAVLRQELAGWAGAAEADRRAEAEAWLGGVLARPERGFELVTAWLAAVLEMPGEPMVLLVDAVVAATAGMAAGDAEQLRGLHSRAMVTFHPPQWMRLRDTFARAAADHGQPQDW